MFLWAKDVNESQLDLTCPACSCSGRPELLTVEDTYRLLRCPVCATQYFRRDAGLSPEGSAGTISEYWEDYKFSVYENPDVQAEFEKRYAEFVELARRESPTLASVLDIGCGIGNFVQFAAGRGLHAYGVDLEPKAVDHAVSRGLHVAHSSKIGELLTAEGQVDLLTMWDVIEHLYDPSSVLGEVSERLREGGLFLLETPDGNFLARHIVRSIYGASKGKIDLTATLYYWEHKIYFTETGLRLLLARHGFDVVRVVRRTSPRHKMQQIFEHDAERSRSPREKIISAAWPALERGVRLAQTGNKLIVLARKR